MQVWNVLHAAHWEYRTQKLRKNRHLRTIPQLCWAISTQLRHVLTVEKKLVKQQYLFHMSPQYGECRPTTGWDRFGSLGHACKFHRVSCLVFVTAVMSLTGGQPSLARLLAISCAGILYIHFCGLLPHNKILPAAKFTFRPNLAFFYIGSVTAQHLSTGRQPNFVALSRGQGGHHVGHRPTFQVITAVLAIGAVCDNWCWL